MEKLPVAWLLQRMGSWNKVNSKACGILNDKNLMLPVAILKENLRYYGENIIVPHYQRLRGLFEHPDPEIRSIKNILNRDEDEIKICKALNR